MKQYVNTPFSPPRTPRTPFTRTEADLNVPCRCASQVIGWKYEAASEESQQYKIGKFILEKGKIAKAGW